MPALIASSARIFAGVDLGEGVQVDDFCLLGVQPGKPGRDLETTIGDDCLLRSHCVVYAGTRLGHGVRLGHGAMVREFCTIGDGAGIGSHTVIEHNVEIGDGASIHSQAFIPEYSVIGAGAWIGPRVCLTNARFPGSSRAKQFLEGVRVAPDARIGANVTVLPGVCIGRGALVGAGAVVTGDVPPGMVALGNPARTVKRVEDLREPNRSNSPPYAIDP